MLQLNSLVLFDLISHVCFMVTNVAISNLPHGGTASLRGLGIALSIRMSLCLLVRYSVHWEARGPVLLIFVLILYVCRLRKISYFLALAMAVQRQQHDFLV